MNGDTGNVVRLPRDWLGPRDELIPFGPAARRAEAAATRATAKADVLELSPRDVVAEALDCTQDGFWGGDLEAIPKPIVGPPPPEAESSPDVVDPGSPRKLAGVCDPDPDGVGSTSQPPHGATLGAGSADLGARVATPRRTRPRHHRRATRHRRVTLNLARPRIPVPAAAGSVAAALAATVVVALPGSGARIAAHHAGPALAGAASSLVLPNTLDPHPRHVAQQRVRPTGHPTRATKARHRSPASTATPTFVKVSAPSQAASAPRSMTSSATSRSTSTVTGPRVSTPVTPTRPTTTATTAAKHKTPAGPVGQGAAFGPGQLG